MTKFSVVAALVVSLLFAPAHARNRAATAGARTLTIGALFDLTGDGATLGRASAAALELAVRDINQELDALHVPLRVVAIVEDTRLTPAIAAEKMALLAARGAQVVMGPQTSAEAAAVREFAGEHGILVVSQASTASSLAIADNLFRFAPNDRLEGEAIAEVLVEDGIDVIVPLWRADAGNSGLHGSTKRSFEARGGSVLEGASYDPATTDFAASVAAIGAQLRALKTAQPDAEAAIFIATFEEAAAIFDLARLDADLAGVRWYGADGVTQTQALISTPEIAGFAAAVEFTSPNVGLSTQTADRWQPIADEIEEELGYAPDAFSLSVYDAAWVAALAAAEVEMRREDLREAFVRNVQRYWGLTGPTSLDAAGDRRFATFDFWRIEAVNGTFAWVKR